MNLNNVSDSVKAELAKLSPEAQAYLRQSVVASNTDKAKFDMVLKTLTNHLDSLEEEFADLAESPDPLTIGTLMLATQLLLGTDSLEEALNGNADAQQQFQNIKAALETLEDNKQLLRLFQHLVLTKQFKASRKKKVGTEEEEPLVEEEAFPFSNEEEEDVAPTVKKRSTLAKAKK
jgi:hypothetical protein